MTIFDVFSTVESEQFNSIMTTIVSQEDHYIMVYLGSACRQRVLAHALICCHVLNRDTEGNWQWHHAIWRLKTQLLRGMPRNHLWRTVPCWIWLTIRILPVLDWKHTAPTQTWLHGGILKINRITLPILGWHFMLVVAICGVLADLLKQINWNEM